MPSVSSGVPRFISVEIQDDLLESCYLRFDTCNGVSSDVAYFAYRFRSQYRVFGEKPDPTATLRNQLANAFALPF